MASKLGDANALVAEGERREPHVKKHDARRLMIAREMSSLSVSAREIRAELEDVAKENADASALCRLLGFALQGNASAKRARLAGLAGGPASRQRLGWLDLALRAFHAGARSPDDLDSESLEPAQLANGSCDLLLDLLERLPARVTGVVTTCMHSQYPMISFHNTGIICTGIPYT